MKEPTPYHNTLAHPEKTGSRVPRRISAQKFDTDYTKLTARLEQDQLLLRRTSLKRDLFQWKTQLVLFFHEHNSILHNNDISWEHKIIPFRCFSEEVNVSLY